MKPILFSLVIFFTLKCYSQTIELSTPQPRLGEEFSLTVSADSIASDVFHFLSQKFEVSEYKSASNSGSVIATNLTAKRIGHNEIGPLNFKVNGKTYMTNKIEFDVVDSLPPVSKGLWMRTTPIDDATAYVIIEQRIPALTYITHDSPNSVSITTKTNDVDKEVDMIQDADRINFAGSHSDFRHIIEPKTGKELKFEYFFALYKIKRTKGTNTVILSRDDFEHIPDYFVFKNILIHY